MKLTTLVGVALAAIATTVAGAPSEGTAVTAASSVFVDSAATNGECTPMMKACSKDGKQLLLCNNNAQYELFKTCPACCRYGNHGYADCYSECDPSKPPDRGESEALTKRYNPPTWIGANCNPGWWTCDVTNAWSMYCNKNRDYNGFANCGKDNCKYGDKPGKAGCGGRHEAEIVAKRDGGPPTWIGANCNPGTYTCDQSNSWTMVCNANRDYIGTSFCGAGCCKYSSQYGVTFCDCRASSADTQTEAVAKRDANGPPTWIGANCNPGTWTCDVSNSWTMVCDANRNYIGTSYCGAGCCKYTSQPGVTKCDCHKGAQADAVEKREAPADSTECDPGTYICDGFNDWILVCGPSGKLQKSAYCGNGTCVTGPNNATAFCDSRFDALVDPAIKRDDVPPPKDLPDDVDPQACIPGLFTCSRNKKEIFICGPDHAWHVSAVCAKEGDCKVGEGGTRFCDPRPEIAAVEKREDISPALPGDPVPDRLAESPCTPGTFTCSERLLVIWTCGPDRLWHVSAWCEKDGDCKEGPGGTRYCDPRRPEIAAAEKREDNSPALLDRDMCKPGTYQCSGFNDTISVCGPDSQWHVSADCGGFFSCKAGPDGTAFCDPRSADVEAAEKREDSVVAPCPPGTADCGDPPKCSCTSGQKKCDKGKLLVCKKCNWELERNCGALECCQNSPVFGSAFCRCRQALERSADPVDASELDADKKKCNCNDGARSCDNQGNLLLCKKCQWTIEKSCGGERCCMRTGLPGTSAECSCRRGCCGGSKTRAVLERSEDMEFDTGKKRNCESGRTTCSRDHSMLLICDRGQWVVKKPCGKKGSCIPDGLFGMGAKCT